MSDSFTVRTATVADAPILARHRAEMFRAAAHGITSLVLHASRDARGLYEKLGFVPTNEMRFAGRRQS